MQTYSDRASVDEAVLLIARYGTDAVVEAAAKADAFRDTGHLGDFCRWLRIEQAVQFLQLEDVIGELH